MNAGGSAWQPDFFGWLKPVKSVTSCDFVEFLFQNYFMDFLFHTVVDFERVLVYYNIHRDGNGFFAEVLDNPGMVAEAKDFRIKKWDGCWMSTEKMPGSLVEKLGEEIDSFYSTKG